MSTQVGVGWLPLKLYWEKNIKRSYVFKIRNIFTWVDGEIKYPRASTEHYSIKQSLTVHLIVFYKTQI